MVGNGTGDQLWEETDEQAVIDEIMLGDFAVVRVHQIGDLLEGKERNRQRQDDVAHRPTEVEGAVECAEKKACVFVITQQGDVSGNAKYQHSLRGPSHQVATDQVVDHHAAHQQRHIGGVPPAVKHQRRQGQPYGGKALFAGAHEKDEARRLQELSATRLLN